MDTVKITFNDNKVHEYPYGTLYYDISKDCDMENIVGFKIGNEVYSLDKKAIQDEKIEFINASDLIGNKIYKSGLKFIFEVALEEVIPKFSIRYEHSVPRGMLGEVVGPQQLTQDDISKIKGKMSEIISNNEEIVKYIISPKDAIKYYNGKGEFEKAENIQNISDKVVTLYKLRNKFNYFYSQMPYTTGAIDKFELVYLGNNKIIFLFPSVGGNKVLEYVHYDNIINSFLEGKKWLNNLQMPYIADLNKTIGNGDIKSFIESSELMFNLNINHVVEDIISNHRDVKFILIAGPSSSGKTTTTKRMSSHFKALGYHTVCISLDDYYIDRELCPKLENGKYDFESLAALNVQRFNDDLKALLDGKEVTLPVFNFLTGKSEISKNSIKLQENSILLIEGLHAINDELTSSIESKYKYKVYLSPFIPLNVDKHNYISTLDMRLLRRIVRDNRTRGYDVVTTIDNWQNVRDGEEKYIFPFIHQANTIINTALAYEVGVLKVYVEPLLLSVSVDSIYYEEARRLVDFLKQFFPIPGEYVSDDSILREFIGGLKND